MDRTMSLRRFMREMELSEGDVFIVTGYSDRSGIPTDIFRLREELEIDIKISQHEVLLVDPKTRETTLAWVITITEGSNKNRVLKKRGRKGAGEKKSG